MASLAGCTGQCPALRLKTPEVVILEEPKATKDLEVPHKTRGEILYRLARHRRSVQNDKHVEFFNTLLAVRRNSDTLTRIHSQLAVPG
ncbi:MAG: hypothetical protein QGG38_08100 [Nitrospinaceae bacterium]|nr:hypothetical protein [Nitrospinaceae bacterium]MDP6712622.1 hypothetical protein [Nitrospinaceae bacterium]